MQPAVQIPDLLHNIVNLPLVCALDLARLSDHEVQRELDGPMNPRVAESPASASSGHILRRDTEPVLARVVCGEGKAAAVGTPLSDYPVVVVEGLFDGYEDGDVTFG